AVCDLYEDRLNRAADAVEKVYGEGNRPFVSTDYKEVLDRDDVDAVLIMSAWESHFPIALYAMERGIAVGMEVGGAYSIDDCWQLVRTYERTKTP
ncbi:Gfo/Idh/MocA family oxidoreductase, partial [Klebsiella pneumoniae]|uniref:Gfo/Idh/MocA family oxidoreductase n=1 Tax=Klebsiella pneumoniae TaxID=573 RepID=UPI0025A251E5